MMMLYSILILEQLYSNDLCLDIECIVFLKRMIFCIKSNTQDDDYNVSFYLSQKYYSYIRVKKNRYSMKMKNKIRLLSELQ